MKQMKKLLSVLLVLCMIFSLMCTALAAEGDDASLKGKVVILHSNDVHGGAAKIEKEDDILGLLGYAKMAALRDEYVKQGAEVILADCGDFIQGSPYVSVSKGANAVEIMNAVGYDVATLGNHEFDFGYENIMTILKDAKFKTVCGDVFKDGEPILDGWTIIEKAGVKIGFVGLETPETYTKVNPAKIQGISFPQKEELYKCAQTLVDDVKAAGADLVIGLFHLGVDAESEPNRSADVYAHVTGIDFILDGHSHSVMTPGDDGAFSKLPIQSTGTKFANIGVVVIDPAEKAVADACLVSTKGLADDAAVKEKAEALMKKVDDQYGAVFAKSEVDLDGSRGNEETPGNRNAETNLGDLITDAMLWSVLREGNLKVPYDHVVAITNGGGIREPIAKGEVTMRDVHAVLPFGNTIAVIYLTGAELRETIEASTFCTPVTIGGFPQVSGMEVTVATDVPYDQGEQYPASTYYGPKSIQRSGITVNGAAVQDDERYAIVTNDFLTAGGDTYHAFKAASEQFDTSIPLDEALMDYITEILGGVIGEEYAEPQGRIFIGTKEEVAIHEIERTAINAILPLLPQEAYTAETAKAVNDAIADFDRSAGLEAKEAALGKLLDAIRALEIIDNTFKDVPEDAWYDPAVDFAAAAGVMNGTGKNLFEPNAKMTRAMVATVLYRFAGSPDVSDLKCDFTDLAEDWYKDAVIWAAATGVTNGTEPGKFSPYDPITREQMAAMLVRYMQGGDPDVTAEEIKELRGVLDAIYSDAASVHDYAVGAVDIVHDMKIMTGDAAESGKLPTFRARDTMTRAECAKVLSAMYAHNPFLLVQPVPAEDAAEALFAA